MNTSSKSLKQKIKLAILTGIIIAFTSVAIQASNVRDTVSNLSDGGDGGNFSNTDIILTKILVSVNNIWTMLANNINSAIAATSDLLYEANPNLPATLQANMASANLRNNVNQVSQPLAVAQISNSLTQKDMAKQEALLALTPASDYYVPSTSLIANIFGGKPKKTNLTAGDTNLDFNSLIAPLAYDKTSIKIDGSPVELTTTQANNFIKLAANLGDPLTSINWSALTNEQKQKLQTDPVGLNFRANLRSIVATRSVGLDNLYQLYAERVPQKNLGLMAGVRDADGNIIANASPLEVDNYLATRRVNSAKWYLDMSKASPATVDRESLIVLAEIQRQLFQLHLDNERLLATLSVMLLQDSENRKLGLQLKESNVKAALGINLDQLPQSFGAPESISSENVKEQLKDSKEDINKGLDKL